MTVINPNNPYLGRLGALLDDACNMLNDVKAGWHVLSGLASAANRGYQEIAADGYWDTTGTLTPTDGDEEYDMRDEVDPRFLFFNSVRPADSTQKLRSYTNWPDLDGLRTSTGTVYTFGYYVKGPILRLVNTPSGCGPLTINYAYSPADLGTLITPTAAAVVNLGGGLVGVPAPLHGLVSGREVTCYGTTNYVGNFTLNAATTINQIVIAATYVAETLTATAGIQPIDSYTPDWPVAYDDVLVNFVVRQAWRRDSSRKEWREQWELSNNLYLQRRAALYEAASGDEGAAMQASRGTE